jgi:hypothetical protein
VPDPGGDRIEGLNVGAWQQQRFGPWASNRKDLDLHAGPFETSLQVQYDLATLHPEQMVTCSRDIAPHKPDGEHVDMSRRDLQRASAVVEKLRVTTIEGDVARWTGASAAPGHCLSLLVKGFGHSWATSLA